MLSTKASEMLRLFSVLSFIAAFAVVYACYGRNWLRRTFPDLEAFYAKLDVIETKLWKQSRTILIARVTSLGSVFVAIHDGFVASGFAGADWTPVTQKLLEPVPQEFRPLAVSLGFTFLGLVFSKLRKVSDGPVGGGG
jgi:hypothetical protein